MSRLFLWLFAAVFLPLHGAAPSWAGEASTEIKSDAPQASDNQILPLINFALAPNPSADLDLDLGEGLIRVAPDASSPAGLAEGDQEKLEALILRGEALNLSPRPAPPAQAGGSDISSNNPSGPRSHAAILPAAQALEPILKRLNRYSKEDIETLSPEAYAALTGEMWEGVKRRAALVDRAGTAGVQPSARSVEAKLKPSSAPAARWWDDPARDAQLRALADRLIKSETSKKEFHPRSPDESLDWSLVKGIYKTNDSSPSGLHAALDRYLAERKLAADVGRNSVLKTTDPMAIYKTLAGILEQEYLIRVAWRVSLEGRTAYNVPDSLDRLTRDDALRGKLYKNDPALIPAFERAESLYVALRHSKRSQAGRLTLLIQENPAEARRVISEIINSASEGFSEADVTYNQEALSMLIGMGEEYDRVDLYSRDDKNRKEQTGYGGTPYSLMRDIVRALNLGPQDVFYDLGSGYGRNALVISLLTPARFKGIELMPERVAKSRALAAELQLKNVEFIPGSVLDKDYSDGTVFFMFNPFAPKTSEAVRSKLRQISGKKQIRIVTFWMPGFGNQDWLEDITPKDVPAFRTYKVSIFRSRQKP